MSVGPREKEMQVPRLPAVARNDLILWGISHPAERVSRVNEVVACLAREEGFEPVVGEIGVILHHDEDLLASPFGDSSCRIQLNRDVGAVAQALAFGGTLLGGSVVEAGAESVALKADRMACRLWLRFRAGSFRP